MSVKCLRSHLETEEETSKKFKESFQNLNTELNEQKDKVQRSACQIEEVTKKNSNLKTKLTALRKHMDKIMDEVVTELQTPQAYFNEMGVQYGDSFEDFRKQAILLFLGLDFSQIQINTLVLMTSAGYDVPNEEEIDLKKAEAFGPEGNGIDGSGEKETDKQPNEPTDKPHA